jgi:glycerophosphoryl diester phosphodiesterase
VRLRVANTHLQHTSAVERLAQTERIMELLRPAKSPIVLVGDLNARPDAPELAPLWTRLVDAWPRGGQGDGFTYPSEAPNARIDYVLTTADVEVESARVLTSPASDHAQLVADLALPRNRQPERPRHFDLQAHRGGLGLMTESTLEAFANALELGVTTLELDVQITEDQVAVVTHDRQVQASKCRDTRPAFPGDPEYPYVGDYVRNLTLAQVRTLRCDKPLPQYPAQRVVEGARMSLLEDVFDLVHCYDADDVVLNVETKVEAGAPEQTAPREQFVQIVAREVREARLLDQVTIQSFDWGALMRMSEVEPRLPIVALTNGDFLQVGQPGASPWLGGIDIDDFGGSLVAAAASFGADAISPVHGNPQDGSVTIPTTALRNAGTRRRGTRHRPRRDPVDDRRQADHGVADGRRRRRDHHELPGPAPRADGRARAEAAEARPRAAPAGLSQMRRCWLAQRASSWRVESWSLRSTLETWLSTVLTDRCRRAATSLYM